MTTAPPALTDLLRALDAEGMRWSLLRPRAALAAGEGDVDILVEPGSLERAERLLQRKGFVLMPMPGPDTHAVRYDAEAAAFVWIHLQAKLRVAGETFPAQEVLEARVERDGVYEPAGDLLMWILLLRALVEKGELPERHRAPLMELAREAGDQAPALEGSARRHGIDPTAAIAAATAGDWPGLLGLSVHRPPPPRSPLVRRLLSLRHLGLRRRSRGIAVAVIGPDGAGKSSLVEHLARRLPLPTRIQYMGLTGGKLPRADALRVPGVVFAARVAILWLRYARGVVQMARGGIVIFDRYTLDGAVPSGMKLTLAGRISRRVQRHACPLPDLVLLLDASGPTLHARSGEYDPEVLERWRTAFTRLEGRVPALEKLDAERPADEVRRRAEALVWRRFGELRGRSPRGAR